VFKKKSLLLLLLAGLLVFFVACGDTDEDDTASTDDPDTEDVADDPADDEDGDTEDGLPYDTEPEMHYHYFVGANGTEVSDTRDTELGQKFFEETGVSFQMEFLVGDLMERLGTMVAGGTYPDVVTPDHGIEMMLDASAFIPLNELLEEHGPNLLEVYGDNIDSFTMTDGNIYYLPFGIEVGEYVPDPNINQGAFWIQRDVLIQNDFPELHGIEEYFDLITAYADENPEIDGASTIPFTGLTYDTNWFTFSNIPNHLAGYPNDGDVQVDMDTHEVDVYGDSDAAYEFLKKLSELNADGYVDREMFVSNMDDFLAKVSSGRVLGFFAYGWQFGEARNALEDAGNPEREFVPLPIVLDDSVPYDQYLDPPAFVQNRGLGITVNAENPERIIQFIDNLVREENQKLVKWGEDGRHHSTHDDGTYYRTEEQVELMKDQDEREAFGMTAFEWNWPVLSGTMSDGNSFNPSGQPEVAALEYDEDDWEVLDAYGVETYSQLFAQPDERPWFPAWSANIPDGSEPSLYETRAEELTQEYYPRLVMAAPGDFDALWDEFVEAYRSVDHLDIYLDFYNETIQQRLEGNWQFEYFD